MGTSDRKFTAKHIAKLVRKNGHGYMLDVDVEYPKALHDKHNELPNCQST